MSAPRNREHWVAVDDERRRAGPQIGRAGNSVQLGQADIGRTAPRGPKQAGR